MRLILLQGPVGLFFSRLAKQAIAQGHEVTQVAFNAGDWLFGHKPALVRFSGDETKWRVYFQQLIGDIRPDAVVYFGCERPAHRIAAKICARSDIRAISLEEGYLRPGFITAELFGNNARSPLAGVLPDTGLSIKPRQAMDYKGAKWMWWYAFWYYFTRELFSLYTDRILFHREIKLAEHAIAWPRNVWRLFRRKKTNARWVDWLTEQHQGNYFVVPLQVESDLHMQAGANGCTNACFIERVIQSFVKHADRQSLLVFKIHPLDRGFNPRYQIIQQCARAHGVEQRVYVIDTGCLMRLTHSSAGMLTINSTSGLSALHHGVPLLVAGDAIYRHPRLCLVAKRIDDIHAFWRATPRIDLKLNRRFLAWVQQRALLPGDFYAPGGIATSVNALEQVWLDIESNKFGLIKPALIHPVNAEEMMEIANG